MRTLELPVRPHLDQLRRQAKELLRDARLGDAAALTLLDPSQPHTLASAQQVLASAYGAPNWPRLVKACRLVEAIWKDDLGSVRDLIMAAPELLHEPVLIRASSWGPPMSYAANLGRDRLIRLLHRLGARDHARALDRATLQGKVATARLIHGLMGSPLLSADALAGPAYTLSVAGTRLALELGALVRDEHGACLAPVDVVLETDSRRPEAKHRILEMYVEAGLELPDTPTMAVHRGRIDLLEAHLRRDSSILTRAFSHEEMYPPDLGCHDEVLATHGTPLAGATLLHMSVDYDEFEIACWLLDRGMKADARAAIDQDGFGGHTPLFSTIVSQPAFWMNRARNAPQARFAELLLRHGADPLARASMRKQLHPGYGPSALHEYRDVTPIEWGERFHDQRFVNQAALGALRHATGEP